MLTDSYSKVFSNKQRILVITAHPDDLELYCGGLVARLIADGKDVRSVKVTSGDMGSRLEKISSQELKSLREIEDSASMKTLGISEDNNVYLHLPDAGVENTVENIGKLAQQIRLFQPELIITHNPTDAVIRFDKNNSWFNHRDHRTTGQLTLDAAYPYARDVLFFPEQLEDPRAKSWACVEFLIVDSYNHEDNVYFDVTETISKRVEAHAQHKSQYSREEAQESADFFTKSWDPEGKKNYEVFRYIKAD